MNRRRLAALILASALVAGGPALAAKAPTTWDELVLVKSKKLDLVYLLPDATRDDWRIPSALATRGTYEVSTRDPTAELTCRVHGGLDTSVRTWLDSSDYRSFEFPETAFGLGIGALTPTREQAAVRLGEIVAAAGAVAHLPTSGAQVPDFDVGLGRLSAK